MIFENRATNFEDRLSNFKQAGQRVPARWGGQGGRQGGQASACLAALQQGEACSSRYSRLGLREQSRADRMPAAKDAAEAEQQEEGAGIPAANEKIEKQRKEWALLIFSSHLCVDLVCVGEREERKRRGRGEKEKTKRRQRERELSLSQKKIFASRGRGNPGPRLTLPRHCGVGQARKRAC